MTSLTLIYSWTSLWQEKRLWCHWCYWFLRKSRIWGYWLWCFPVQDNDIPGQKRALSVSIALLLMLSTFRHPFTARFFFNRLIWRDICNSLFNVLPLPLKKIDFFLRGGGVCTQTKCAKHSHYIDYHNRYHIHSPRIQTESLSKRFFKGFSLKFCKFGGDTKAILPTSVCLFILCAAMAGTKQIYATIICDLLLLLTPYWKPRGLGVQGIKPDEMFKVK